MNSEKFYIPRHLDDAPRFLLWSVDEAMSGLLPVFLGGVMGLGVYSAILALLSFKLWKRIKGSGGQSFVKAAIYWYYPKDVLGLKHMPDSAIRKFIS